ncbi:MmgE/PrpD family protein [Candidatus Berkelbacteria bacterium]|nr:MmgE/PrpD family protein [Candidatus Berkelbacteria bacterium]
MNISAAIAQHVSTSEYESLPEEAIAAAKRSFLDTLGVALAGSKAPGMDAVASIYAHQGGAPESSVWGDCSRRLPAMSAALLNGLAAASLDYDGLHPIGLVHPGIVTIPAALAVSERVHASGRQFLTAVALADDLMCRMALSHSERRGWNFTAVYGGLAASIAASKIIGLSRHRLQDAMGLAYITASGTQQPAAERSLAKRMQSAHASQCGVWAALLAEKGYNGPAAIFEGKFGIYNLYEPGDFREVINDLGVRFENTRISMKKYPSCGCTHAVLDGLLDIISEHAVSVDRVRAIETIISPYMDRLVGAPFSPGENPQVAAQFSVQYAVACALLFRRFSLDELRIEKILDSRVREVANRVKITVDASNGGGVAPAEIKITLADGTVIHRRVEDLKGSPSNPFTDPEVEEKFIDCVLHGDSERTRVSAQSLYSMMSRVEEADDMATFFEAAMRTTTGDLRALADA